MDDGSGDGYSNEEINLQPLEDDNRLLGSMLDQCLRQDIGDVMFARVEKLRAMSQCAATLSVKGAETASQHLSDQLIAELSAMPIDEAIPLTRASAHYLALTGIAELQHRLRRNRLNPKRTTACDDVFGRLISEGLTGTELYNAIVNQTVEIVLTAHPTQVNRRTLQYKHTRIAALLQQKDRSDAPKDERDEVLDNLMREVMSLWETDELRRVKPTPLDEARSGLHLLEQSLWTAVPSYMRTVSKALKEHTGRDLPLGTQLFKYASWMGGDRDGNPNVTAAVTAHVIYLSRWMAADMFLREVDALHFELSMHSCSHEAWSLATEISRSKKASDDVPTPTAILSATGVSVKPVSRKSSMGGMRASVDLSRPSSEAKLQPSSSGRLTSVGRASSNSVFHTDPTEAPMAPPPGAPGFSSSGPSGGAGPSSHPLLMTRNCSQSAFGNDGQVPTPHPAKSPRKPSMSQRSQKNTAGSFSTIPAPLGFGAMPGRTSVEGGIKTLGMEAETQEALDALLMQHPEAKELLRQQLSSVPGVLSSFLDLDRAASVGLADPTLLRNTLRNTHSRMDAKTFRRTYEHPGVHPYRIILQEARERLMATRHYYEDMLSDREPSVHIDDTYQEKDDLEGLLRTIYWSLYECGGGLIADGRLLDLMRRLSTFDLSLLKLDIRQESTRHSETLDAITQYLGMGSYLEWDEDTRLEFLTKELQGRRPLVPSDMPMTDEVREVLDTFRMAARMGRVSLGAYVISMAKSSSDVLAVELLQREAALQVAAETGTSPKLQGTLRVAPLFEMLEDLHAGGAVVAKLLANPWYREHLRTSHDNHQEVMLGYSDSGKDAGRLAANWALYRCQEDMVKVVKDAGIKLTLFHGRGGTVGRGGGPTHLAIQSQPGGSVDGSFRITEQGEMVQAKFGIPAVAMDTMEIYTTAVLLATVRPPPPPKSDTWRTLMEEMGRSSCASYRGIVADHPKFIAYFQHATPEAELGSLNIGSRPSRRKADISGISTLRAIPWVFAWTQTRLILPSWLGVGTALAEAIEAGHRDDLKRMYKEWPFFKATVDLIEMILAKCDERIAALYDEVLVQDPEEKALGVELRARLARTIKLLLDVTGESEILANNTSLKRLIQMRNPYIEPLNILQVEIIRRLRTDPDNSRLRDAMLLSINGISAGMRNTG